VKNDEFEHLLSDLEVRLERLRSLYEQYFIGIERIEPGVPRKDVDRRFWELRKIRVRNTALRFRLQTLIQRYNTLQQYWVRICRQIENGTYVRQLRKAVRTADAQLPQPTAPQVAAPPPAADAKAPPGELSRERVAALHEELSAARKGLQQGNVSVESVEKRIRDTEAQLRERHPGRAIDFRVEIKDGKAVIKPFIRR
jgi:hypothetical protein